MQLILVYITTKDKSQAEEIGKKLVEEKLAGCVNIIDGMKSIYYWDNSLQQDCEAILIAKTAQHLLPQLTSRVSSFIPTVALYHSASTDWRNPDYLQWLQRKSPETHL